MKVDQSLNIFGRICIIITIQFTSFIGFLNKKWLSKFAERTITIQSFSNSYILSENFHQSNLPKNGFYFFKYAKNDLCDNLWNFVNYANLVTNCLYISNITIELSIWMIFAIQCNLHKKFINPRWLTNRTKSRFTTISGRSRHLIVTTGLTSWQRLVSTSERWWIFRDDFE